MLFIRAKVKGWYQVARGEEGIFPSGWWGSAKPQHFQEHFWNVINMQPPRSGCAQTAQFLTFNSVSLLCLEILTYNFKLITPPNLCICWQQLTQTCPFVHQTRETNISGYADEALFSWITTGRRLCVQSGDTVMKTSSEIKLSANEKNFASAL